MPRPICAACCIEYRCIKNEALVRDPEDGPAPSTYWSGDMFKCPGCGNRIIVGFGQPMDSNLGEVLADREGVLEFRYTKKGFEISKGDTNDGK